MRRVIVAPHTRCVDWNVQIQAPFTVWRCRTSHEVRGLKCRDEGAWEEAETSHLTRGAWIEITISNTTKTGLKVAPHTRCVDWNSNVNRTACWAKKSHLTRGAWIEIGMHGDLSFTSPVAPHTRCVDWNRSYYSIYILWLVSHLTRGAWIEIGMLMPAKWTVFVAPHTRCVDWNIKIIYQWFIKGSRTSHEVRGLKWRRILLLNTW